MSDIEFDQIRQGQTVRLHCRGGFTVEGPVLRVWVAGASDPLSAVQIGSPDGVNATARRLITRVELLSEPAPKWKVGQLAEIDWSSSGCAGATRPWLARWDGEAWVVLDEGVRLSPHWDGEPRLLQAVPADAVVLPAMNEAEATTWRAAHFRTYAELALGWGAKHMAGSLQIIADAIEAVE